MRSWLCHAMAPCSFGEHCSFMTCGMVTLKRCCSLHLILSVKTSMAIKKPEKDRPLPVI